MSQYAVQVQGISKKYQIGSLQSGEQTFREAMTDMLTAPFRRVGNLFSGQAYGAANLDETIWALKDINFDVKHGEIIGIIGHNGAGKSTLLKILSRITEPTSGEIKLYGRVGALLEVGTGFHAELTGRENIYLNGTILGMSRAEINKKFDEIVDFSGIEKFIDTPVKHYSSGMGLRLGFAVAAHLEPEILAIDEVLAVGDAEFQKKCLGKMSDVASSGRTVLFVSHNMAAVQNLCSRGIYLKRGQIVTDGPTEKTIETYLSDQKTIDSSRDLEQLKRSRADLGDIARISSLKIYDSKSNLTNTIGFSEAFDIELTCNVYKSINDVSFLIGIDSILGDRIMTITSLEDGKLFSGTDGQTITARLHIKDLLLKPGRYHLTVGLFSTNKGIDSLLQVGELHISDASTGKIHISQVTIGYLQLTNPDWQIN